MLSDFRKFLLRGNVLDLAVAVVIGAAFGAMVSALVSGLLTPLVAAIFGNHDFSNLSFTINGSVFRYGAFLNAVISFLSVGFAVFYFIVTPVKALRTYSEQDAPPDERRRECPECLNEIPALARRCPACTAQVEPTA